MYYQAPVGPGPALMVLLGVGVVAGWLWVGDPELAERIATSRRTDQWLVLGGLLLAATVGVGMVVNAYRMVGQMVQGLTGLVLVVAVVVGLVLWGREGAPVATAMPPMGRSVATEPVSDVPTEEPLFTGFDDPLPDAEDIDTNTPWYEQY